MTDDSFLVALHRSGNAMAGVLGVDALSRERAWCYRGRMLQLAPEIDVKWLCDGNDVHLYGYHGPQVPGFRFDLFRSASTLARRQREGRVLSLSEAFANCPSLFFVLELKSGIGPMEAALDALAALLEETDAWERVALICNDVPRLALARQKWPTLPMGTMHAWANDKGVCHQADYRPLRSWQEAGLLIPYHRLPGSFVMVPQRDPAPILNAGKRYFQHRVHRYEAFVHALSCGAMGAFVYQNTDVTRDWLERLAAMEG